MRNLVNFIWRYHFTLTFIGLELVAFFLIIQSNNYHQGNFFSATTSMSGGVFDFVNNTTEYLNLKEVNDQLREENAVLRARQNEAFTNVTGRIVTVDDSVYFQQYDYVVAKVIRNSFNKQNNHLYLDKGYLQGIDPGMGVMGPDGVIGEVTTVTKHYSLVASILHQKTKIPVMLLKDGSYGFLTWDGKDPQFGLLEDLPRHIQLEEGDSLVTKGSSGIFPEGVPVGTVESYEEVPGSSFYKIKVRFSTPFHRVSYGYIIKNYRKTELEELEEAEKNDDPNN